MKNKKIDIVGLGACGVDLRVKVLKLPTTNEKTKILAENFKVVEGGVTANNLVQAARLGLKSLWIGSLGNDNWGKHLLKKFKAEKISYKPIFIKDSATQQFWIISDNRGKSNMIGIPGATQKISVNEIRKLSNIITGAKHFHTEIAVIPLKIALEGIKIAKNNNIKVFVDIDDDPWRLIKYDKIGTKKEFVNIIKTADIIKFSKNSALSLVKEKKISKKTAQKIISLGAKILFITLGDKGCYVASKKFFYYIPGFKVKIVDTVGAGDAFMGGLSYGFLQNWDIKKIAIFANACGAYKSTQFGTRSSGNLKQIKQLINKKYGRF